MLAAFGHSGEAEALALNFVVEDEGSSTIKAARNASSKTNLINN